MKNTKYVAAATLLVALSSIGAAVPALADSTAPLAQGKEMRSGMMRGGGMMHRGVFGTVSAINGNTLTVSSKGFGPNAAATSYTVDATNAKVMKAGAAATLSAIAVGDTVMVQGTVTGTTIAATSINDGPKKGTEKIMPAMPAITGNGQPVVAGNVTAISGGVITITNKSNVTYTIDATNAKIVKGGVTASTINTIVVGDQIVAQGTVNGSAVTASSIIDQGAVPTANSAGTGTQPEHRGFFGSIGHFFSGLFGF